MSYMHICDGCGEVIEGRPKFRGQYLQATYCSGCDVMFEDLEKRETEALQGTAQRIADELQGVRRKFVEDKQLKRPFKLPDGAGALLKGGLRMMEGKGSG